GDGSLWGNVLYSVIVYRSRLVQRLRPGGVVITRSSRPRVLRLGLSAGALAFLPFVYDRADTWRRCLACGGRSAVGTRHSGCASLACACNTCSINHSR